MIWTHPLTRRFMELNCICAVTYYGGPLVGFLVILTIMALEARIAD